MTITRKDLAHLGQRRTAAAVVASMLPTLPKRREGPLVRELVSALRAVGCQAFRMNTGAVQENGRFVRFGLKGMSDILGAVTVPCGCGRYAGCLVCEGKGKVAVQLAVECKSQDGKLSPHQRAFLSMIEAAGGIAVVARSVDDVIPLVLRRMGQR